MTDQFNRDFSPIADEVVIDSLETLKIIADPQRKRILGEFSKPSTVKEVAGRLNTSPSKLYYHVNMLEEHGLLRVTDTRVVSGIIEKQYQVAGRVFRVKPGLLSPAEDTGDEGLTTLLNDVFDTAKEEILASVRAGVVELNEDGPEHRKLHMGMMSITLTPERALEFYERLRELADAMSKSDHDEDSAETLDYIIQYAMFPVTRTGLPDDASEG